MLRLVPKLLPGRTYAHGATDLPRILLFCTTEGSRQIAMRASQKYDVLSSPTMACRLSRSLLPAMSSCLCVQSVVPSQPALQSSNSTSFQSLRVCSSLQLQRVDMFDCGREEMTGSLNRGAIGHGARLESYKVRTGGFVVGTLAYRTVLVVTCTVIDHISPSYVGNGSNPASTPCMSKDNRDTTRLKLQRR
jgi:hypothetical protein